MKRLRRIFIGLGANLGDRLENLRKALDLLKEHRHLGDAGFRALRE